MPDACCMDSCCVDEGGPAALEVPVWVVLAVFGWAGFLDLGRNVDRIGPAWPRASLNGVPSLAEDFPRFGCAFLVENLDPPSHAFFHAAPDCFPGVVGECSGPQSTLWTWIGALRLMSKKKRNSCLPNHCIFSSET